MSISGVVIHVRPDGIDAAKARVAAVDGVEVHAATAEGRIAVTVDRPNDRAAADAFEELRNIDGVLNTSLVYNYFEPDPAGKEHAR